MQAQCPDSIFTEASSFPQESSDISLLALKESQCTPVPQASRFGCPVRRGLHQAHTCGRSHSLRGGATEEGQHDSPQNYQDLSENDANRPAPDLEASHRKRQDRGKPSPKMQLRKKAMVG